MATRTINVSLLTQKTGKHTIEFTPDLTSVDGDVLLKRKYVFVTDTSGDATITLPVKASGTIRYTYKFPTDQARYPSTGEFYLEAGSAIDLDDLIVAGVVATDSVLDYIDAQTLTSYLAATVTYNNIDVLAETALSVDVEAGGIYDIELRLHSTAVSRALLLDFGGTATITNFVGDWLAYNVVNTLNNVALRVTAAGTDFTATAIAGAAEAYYTFKGSIEVNAAGTFLLRGAQTLAAATNTTILRGSLLKLIKTN